MVPNIPNEIPMITDHLGMKWPLMKFKIFLIFCNETKIQYNGIQEIVMFQIYTEGEWSSWITSRNIFMQIMKRVTQQ